MLLHCNWHFVTVVNGHMLICAEIFMRGLSACIFDMHQPDVVTLKARLTKDGKSDADNKALSSKYFRDRYVCLYKQGVKDSFYELHIFVQQLQCILLQ